MVVSTPVTDTNFDDPDVVTATAACSGATPNRIGGGAELSDNTAVAVVDSFPSGGTTPGTSWTGTATAVGNNGSVTLTVYAICAP